MAKKKDPLDELTPGVLELVKEVKQLYDWLNKPLDRSSPEALLEELDLRGQYLARSAEIMADAQVILDRKRGKAAESHIGTGESWNIVKSLIEASCQEEKRLNIQAERLNATITHQMDEIRTLISFEKESMRAMGGKTATEIINQLVDDIRKIKQALRIQDGGV